MTLVVSLGCGYWSIRLGRADLLAREATANAARKSTELAPGNSKYLQYAAITAEDNGGDGMPLRARAAQLNPLDSWNWIQLAAEAEVRSEIAAAERYLLRAFDVDRQFQPRWALANFYLRQGDRDRALGWARKTLDFGAGDLNAVFQLCWNTGSNGDEILGKAIPARPEVLVQYLAYLDATSRPDEAEQVAGILLPVAGTEQEPALAAHCNRALGLGRAKDAIAVWNGLVERGLIEGERVEPGAGRSLVNAGFAREFSGVGFDWAAQAIEGVTVERLTNGSGVRVDFSRNEPQNCVILGQYVTLMPQRKYRFRVHYEAPEMSGAGITWVIYDPRTKVILLSAGPSGLGSAEVEAEFQAPPELSVARLELRYVREPGTVRPEGSIRFSHLELGFAP
jgi:tetratricopeptide (TPR) repeat protein